MDVLPVISRFMGFGPPSRDDATFIVGPVGIDHCNLDAVHQTDGVDPDFRIDEAVVFPLDSRPVEYAFRIVEGNAMPPNIDRILVRVPDEPHIHHLICIYVLSIW